MLLKHNANLFFYDGCKVKIIHSNPLESKTSFSKCYNILFLCCYSWNRFPGKYHLSLSHQPLPFCSLLSVLSLTLSHSSLSLFLLSPFSRNHRSLRNRWVPRCSPPPPSQVQHGTIIEAISQKGVARMYYK